MQIHRRRFLAGTAAALVGSATPVPRIFAAANHRAVLRGANRILVVVQLTGGNDGLNTVIPYGDDEYHKNRFATRISTSDVLKVNEYLGWHPALRGFADLQQSGKLSIVQGVGYPNPNRSHFESMDIWHSASLSGPHRTGWLGRTCEIQSVGKNAATIPGIHLGTEPLPLAMTGLNVMIPSLASIESLRFASDETVRAAVAEIASDAQSKDELREYLRMTRQTALSAARRLESVEGAGDLPRGYPGTSLARTLSFVSKLIQIDFGPRVYYVSMGSFDTHSQQAAAHAALLNELGGAVAAFQSDLDQAGRSDEVLTLCFSEFGRRVKENGSAGTDHGTAAPLFVAGNNLPATVGSHPSLTKLVDGDLTHSIDFRSVYATVLARWLELDSKSILGEEFPLIEMLT